MLFLHGVGHFHPENVIDNAFFESLDIGTNDQWIMERVGIRRRRTVLPLSYIRETRNAHLKESFKASLYSDAQTGAAAARMALERAGITPEDIGLVVAGSGTPEYSIPSCACMIAGELGISAPAYDVTSACATFAFQMHTLNSMHADTLPDYVLVVNVDNVTRAVDYNDRRSSVLFGDASAAVVISPRKKAPCAITYTTIHSDPSGWNKIYIPTGGYFWQDGQAVQTFAIRKTEAILKELRNHMTGGPSTAYFIGHQANLLVLEGVCRRAEIEASRHLFNVDEYGNCHAAGAPSVLSQCWNRFKAGDEIAVSVVGSGLSWGGVLMKVGI